MRLEGRNAVYAVTSSPPTSNVSSGRHQLLADATGVGRPVVELLKQARMKCELWPVTITGGDTERQEGGSFRVPKGDLIIGLQVNLSAGELEIASGTEWSATLLKEMAAMKVRMRGSREQFGASQVGEHDDLVQAVSLACWGVRKMHRRVAGDVGHWVRDGGGALF